MVGLKDTEVEKLAETPSYRYHDFCGLTSLDPDKYLYNLVLC